MKNKFLRNVCMSLVIMALVAGISGCGKDNTGADKAGANKAANTNTEDKVIRVGCEATTPGWIQTDKDGKLTGYDYEVWQEIGKRTGYTIDYKVMEWDGMWPMLEDGRLDTVGEQISMTDERKEKYEFTEPYAYNYYCLISAKDNPELNTLDDLKTGMTISCETNSSDEVIVDTLNKQYGIELKPMYYSGMSVKDVALGRCDLWPRAETSSMITVKEVDNLKILGVTDILETNAYPFAKTEKGKELAALTSKAIKEMKEDGTLKELSEKWFGMDITTPDHK